MYFLGHVIGIDGTVAQEGAEESPLFNTSWGGGGDGPTIILSINNCIIPFLTIIFSHLAENIAPFDHFGLPHVWLKKRGYTTFGPLPHVSFWGGPFGISEG